MEQSRLDAIRARVEAAEMGPWKCYMGYIMFDKPGEANDCAMVAQVRGWGRLTDNPGHMTPEDAMAQQEANGQLVAHARTDIPDLLGEVARLTAALGKE